MKKKIKLKDLTQEQFDKYRSSCQKECLYCPFMGVRCKCLKDSYWFNNKDMFSDKFLNQEVEIEVPDLLTQEEKEYLEAVLKPYKDRVIRIALMECFEFLYLSIFIRSINIYDAFECIKFPMFKRGTMYKGLKLDKEYTLDELGLFQNEKKYKIKFSEFWKRKNELAIHCKTLEEAKIFCEKSDKLGKKWVSYDSYLLNNNWEKYRENTYYSNRCQYGIKSNFDHIYEFEDVDFDN